MRTVLPIITDNAGFSTVNYLLFNNLKKLTNGTTTKATPSCCDGLTSGWDRQPDPKWLGALHCAIYYYYRDVLTQLTSLLRDKAVLGRLPSDGAATAGAWGPVRYTVCGLMNVNQDTAMDSNAYTATATYHGEAILKLYTIHLDLSKDLEVE